MLYFIKTTITLSKECLCSGASLLVWKKYHLGVRPGWHLSLLHILLEQ